MSHSTLLVIGPHTEDELAEALAPFDENTEVEPYLDEDGDETTYNPKSRWDWYTIGGRWHRNLIVLPGVTTTAQYGEPSWGMSNPDGLGGVNFVDRLSDLDLDATPTTFAVLTPDGEWRERGRMGWFGMVSDEQPNDSWSATWRALVEAHTDQPAFLVDVHI